MADILSEKIVVLRDWIVSKHSEMLAIDLDTDLIENRLIDSLQFAEFLFVLEDMTGTVIDLQDVDLDTFRTLRSIQSRFFHELQSDMHA